MVIRIKTRMKTDQCIEEAQKIEKHFDNQIKVLILDSNVESAGFDTFEVNPKIKGEEKDEQTSK